MKSLISQKLRNSLRPPAYGFGRALTAFRSTVLKSNRTPDFLILGAQKSGTTTLYDLLVQNPGITSARMKEIAYFDRYYQLGENWYAANFPRSSNTLTGEATPDYLYLAEARERVIKDIPDAKFIVVLRNPVDRAISHYFHARRLGYEPLTIEAAFAAEEYRIGDQGKMFVGHALEKRTSHSAYSYRARGRYAEQLEAWFDVLPKSQFRIVLSEQLFANPGTVAREMFEFLGVRPSVGHTGGIKNVGTYSDHVSERLITELRDYYAPENARLAQLTKLDIPW